jgi:Na+/melibiose symporter-like transporter
MTPDVMEVDELMSGRRQEGVYSGILTFIDKLARMAALAPPASGPSVGGLCPTDSSGSDA